MLSPEGNLIQACVCQLIRYCKVPILEDILNVLLKCFLQHIALHKVLEPLLLIYYCVSIIVEFYPVHNGV